MRLVGGDPDRPWDGRGHFFAAAAEAMRRILVENARRKHRHKRGGSLIRDAAGNLFGITEFGGDLASQNPLCGGFGCGVVYTLSPARNSKDK